MDVVPFEAAVAYTRITLLLGTSLVARFAHSNLHDFDFFSFFFFLGGGQPYRHGCPGSDYLYVQCFSDCSFIT